MNTQRNQLIAGGVAIILIVAVIAIVTLTRKHTAPVAVDATATAPVAEEVKTEKGGTWKKITPSIVTSATPKSSSCDTGYAATPESIVVSEMSAALITGIEKKCDGNYYVTVDYLVAKTGKPGAGIESYYSNANLDTRTFRLSQGFTVALVGNAPRLTTPIGEYLPQIQKHTLDQALFGRTVTYSRPGAPTSVYNLKIQNGSIAGMDEVSQK